MYRRGFCSLIDKIEPGKLSLISKKPKQTGPPPKKSKTKTKKVVRLPEKWIQNKLFPNVWSSTQRIEKSHHALHHLDKKWCCDLCLCQHTALEVDWGADSPDTYKMNTWQGWSRLGQRALQCEALFWRAAIRDQVHWERPRVKVKAWV